MKEDIKKIINIIEDAGYIFMGTEVDKGKKYYSFIYDSGNADITYYFTAQNMKRLVKENKLDFRQLIGE